LIADASGKLEQTMNSDVFGARRDAKTWAGVFTTLFLGASYKQNPWCKGETKMTPILKFAFGE